MKLENRWSRWSRYMANSVAIALILIGLPLNFLTGFCGISFARRNMADPKGRLGAAIRHSMICGIVTVVLITVVFAIIQSSI